MRIICSYCSAAKRRDEAPLPAIERYRSGRLRALRAAGAARGAPLHILSGRLGLVAATTPIPWYDHLLAAGEVAAMAARVASSLRELGAEEVEYHTADPVLVPAVAPYLAAIGAACEAVGARLSVVLLEGNPE